jgi:two-component system cell cycle response regulator DivK
VPGQPILVVDDNDANAKLLRVLLTAHGYDVSVAGNAEQTFASVSAKRPALILLDLQLPGIDGFEIARQLKGAPETKAIIVIAVTAYAMKGDEERARAAGCDGYVAKPIDTRALPQLVERYLAAPR